VGNRIDGAQQRVAEGANLEKAQQRADVLRMLAGQCGDQIEFAQEHRHLLNKQHRRDLQRITAAHRRDPNLPLKAKVLLRQIVEAVRVGIGPPPENGNGAVCTSAATDIQQQSTAPLTKRKPPSGQGGRP